MPITTKPVVVVRSQRMETWEFPLSGIGAHHTLVADEVDVMEAARTVSGWP